MCHYSEAYLRLRARQKKLQALKLGRNWVTTKRWLKNYEASVHDWEESIRNRKNIDMPVPALPAVVQNNNKFVVKIVSAVVTFAVFAEVSFILCQGVIKNNPNFYSLAWEPIAVAMTWVEHTVSGDMKP